MADSHISNRKSVSQAERYWRYIHSSVGRHNIAVWQHRAVDVLISILSLVAVVIIGWTTIWFSMKDYRVRRRQALLDTVLEIRACYSEEWVANGNKHPTPERHSVEGVKRLNLRRRLQANLACFRDENKYPLIRQLAYEESNTLWDWNHLEAVVDQAMEMMREDSKTLGSP